MQSIFENIAFIVQNEHDLENASSQKALFSIPKIYNSEGKLNKRWYVYFSYKDSPTGKMKRMKNSYGKANRLKTKEARYSLLTLYRKRLLKKGSVRLRIILKDTIYASTKLRSSNNPSVVNKEVILDALLCFEPFKLQTVLLSH